jgi:hypothetical protein
VLFIGRTEGAVEALEQALARYERKENLLMAGRARAFLAEPQPSGTAAEPATPPACSETTGGGGFRPWPSNSSARDGYAFGGG